jgi:hypothetical protein
VRVAGSKIGVPRIGVGVELKQRERTVGRVGGAEKREADRVIPAESEHPPAVVGDRARRLFDRVVTGLDVQRARRRVTGIHDLDGGERRDALRLVIGPQQQRRFPDRRGAEARARPKSRRGVEGRPQHGHVGPAHLLERAQARKGAKAGKAWHRQRVDLPDRFLP